MSKLPTKTLLKRKCDTLFSKIIREAGKCDWCGRDGRQVQLQCSHVVSRKYLKLRWDENNANALCAGCHMRWHSHPIEAIEWFKSKYPARYDYLMQEKIGTHKMTLEDYKQLYQNLKEQYA